VNESTEAGTLWKAQPLARLESLAGYLLTTRLVCKLASARGRVVNVSSGSGPGVQEVATFSVDVSGAHGVVAVSNAHGTVTGAAGGVLLRPFARLISKDGDSVTTYGEHWNMN
jgi:MspA